MYKNIFLYGPCVLCFVLLCVYIFLLTFSKINGMFLILLMANWTTLHILKTLFIELAL